MSEKLLKDKPNEILNHIGVSPKVSISQEDDTFKVAIEGDDLSFLIGYRGESLNALQTLLTTMLFNELNEWVRVLVDINSYREIRNDKIQEMTKNFIDRVRFHKSEVELPTMNAFERRQVHVFVSEYPDIASESIGEGRDRRVVLKLKENVKKDKENKK